VEFSWEIIDYVKDERTVRSKHIPFMAKQNEYPGYVKLPKKKLYHANIRLDFNGLIRPDVKGVKLDGFSLRMFTLEKRFPLGKRREEQPEISVTLRPEEWLDLIVAMKDEYEAVWENHKGFD
jgi:hypothetical protein